jgi:hypothetical protein
MRAIILVGLMLAALSGICIGCATSPADIEAAREAWAARDRDRAAECTRQRGRYFDGSCISGGGP